MAAWLSFKGDVQVRVNEYSYPEDAEMRFLKHVMLTFWCTIVAWRCLLQAGFFNGIIVSSGRGNKLINYKELKGYKNSLHDLFSITCSKNVFEGATVRVYI